MTLELVDITPENWRQFTRLEIAETQRGHVADTVLMLARAYVYRGFGGQAYGICRDALPIGVLVQRDDCTQARQSCILDQLLIAAPYQGQGYGTAIMRQWIDRVRHQRSYDTIRLCYVAGDAAAEAVMRFYQRLGFEHDGEDWENEIGMELKLR